MQKLSVTMTPREQALGFGYLAFSQLVLPYLLSALLPAIFPKIGSLGINLTFFILNFLAVCVIFRSFLLKSLKSLPENGARMVAVVAIGYLLHQIFLLLISLLIAWLQPEFSNVNDAQVGLLTAKNYPVMFISTVFLAPVTEELLYRGALFGWFYEKKPVLAYLISVPVFCAIHVMGYIGHFDPLTLFFCFLQYIPAGLCLGWAYHKADNIFAPIFIHALVNAGSILAMR